MTDTIVECYSGHTYAERPRVLCQDGKRFEIETIEAEWHSPKGRHFRVITKNGDVFELIYDQATDNWQLISR